MGIFHENAPRLWRLESLIRACDTKYGNGTSIQLQDGSYVPARGIWYSIGSHRLITAWKVFTGHADAVVWPEDEESENDQ